MVNTQERMILGIDRRGGSTVGTIGFVDELYGVAAWFSVVGGRAR